MATVTINGSETTSDDPKIVRRALDKARREEKKAEQARAESCAAARAIAEHRGYNVLSHKASGGTFPRGWTVYYPGDKWAPNLFTLHADVDGFTRHDNTMVRCDPAVIVQHYNQDFIAAVCGGSGYAWMIFLQERQRTVDGSNGPILSYAIGSCNGLYVLADCPGINPSDFRRTTKNGE